VTGADLVDLARIRRRGHPPSAFAAAPATPTTSIGGSERPPGLATSLIRAEALVVMLLDEPSIARVPGSMNSSDQEEP